MLADAAGPPQVTIDDWTLTRLSISFSPGFSVHVQATRQLGSAVLTFDISGSLGDFTSNGALHVRDSHLTSSRMGVSGLAGRLTAQWSLSAPVAHPIAGLLALDMALPLFREPLLIGDFPLFLSVGARLRLAPLFGPSAQVLGGRADIGFSGGQGLTFDEHSIAGYGGLSHPNHGPPAITGHPFALPGLELAATFPYLEVGDDLNNPLAGGLAWTGLTLDTQARSGNAGPCLRTDATVHADAGLTVWLFGLRGGVSWRFYTHLIGSASPPPSPQCNPA
jgi:hypothetical protein